MSTLTDSSSVPAGAASHPPGDIGRTQLRGVWLLVARVGWIVLVLMTLALFAAGVPAVFERLRGQAIDHQGEEWSAPYRGPGAVGIEPAAIGLDVISDIPVMVAASGPQMTSLAAEIGDGWMPPGWGRGWRAS